MSDETAPEAESLGDTPEEVRAAHEAAGEAEVLEAADDAETIEAVAEQLAALELGPHDIWGFPIVPIQAGPWGMQCRRRRKVDPTDLAEEEHFDFVLSNPGGNAEIIASKKELLRTLKSCVAWIEGDDSHGFGEENSPMMVLTRELEASRLAMPSPEAGIEAFLAGPNREQRRGNPTHPRARP